MKTRDLEQLKKLYAEPGRVNVTAHRGFSEINK
jgi:hypothetical protein